MRLSALPLLASLAFVIPAGLPAAHVRTLSMRVGFVGGPFDDSVDGIARIVEEEPERITITPATPAGRTTSGSPPPQCVARSADAEAPWRVGAPSSPAAAA
jgi:hypothetical protein